jgi:serine/threonine protein kinase
MNITISNYSYSEKDELGRGGYGIAYKGINNITKTPVVIKINFKQTSNETDSLRKLYEDGVTSPYVMQYYDEFITENKTPEQRILILEYIQGRDIRSFCDLEHLKNPVKFWRVMYQLFKGLQFIHSKGLAHKDIHMYNILLTDDDIVKYIDFGMSCLDNCPQSNKDCTNICERVFNNGPLRTPNAQGKSLTEYQVDDIYTLYQILKNLYDYKEDYFNFISNTPLRNNYCNLAEVKQDDRSKQFLDEMRKKPILKLI